MIEEVQVTKVDKNLIWVEASGCEQCSQCAAGEGCRNSRLFSLFAPRRKRFPLPVSGVSEYQVGDRVNLSFSSQGLVMAATLAHLVPLIMLLGLSLIGHYLLALSEPALVLFLLGSGFLTALMARWLKLTEKWRGFLIPRIVKSPPNHSN